MKRTEDPTKRKKWPRNKLSERAWIGLLKQAFDSDFDECSIAADWEAINTVLVRMNPRLVKAAELRWGKGMAMHRIGPRLDRSTGWFFQKHYRIQCHIKHPARLRRIRQCIAGWWNISQVIGDYRYY